MDPENQFISDVIVCLSSHQIKQKTRDKPKGNVVPYLALPPPDASCATASTSHCKNVAPYIPVAFGIRMYFQFCLPSAMQQCQDLKLNPL
jgi:hypothetical protein